MGLLTYLTHVGSAAVAGALTGSVLTVIVERLPAGEPFLLGRSRCPGCRTPLAARDLLPIASFFLLRGRCRHCGQPIPRWHFWVELGTVLLFVGTYLLGAADSLGELVFLLASLALLFALAVIDLRNFLLPDLLVGALATIGLARSLVFGTPGLFGSLIGGAAGLAALGVLAVIPWPPVRRSIGGGGPAGFPPATNLRAESFDGSPAHRRESVGGSPMGLGDVKLAGAMGIALGLSGLLVALFLAFVGGGMVGGLLVATRRASLKSRIPFGPFLCGATAVVLLFPDIPQQFLRLFGME